MGYQEQRHYSGAARPPSMGPAVATLILGLLSFICFGPLLGLVAIICGATALAGMRRDPERYRGRGLAIAGMISAVLATLIWVGAGITFVAMSVQSSRKAATLVTRQKDAVKVKELVRAALRFAEDDHGGWMPAEWDGFWQYTLSTSYFVSPASETMSLQPPFSPHTDGFSDQLAEHCDYTYIGNDINLHQAPTIRRDKVIILYTTRDYFGGRNVGFLDGHVEFVPNEKLEAVFDESNRARAQVKLAEVALDGPSPVSPALQSLRDLWHPERTTVPVRPPVANVTPRQPPPAHTTFADSAEALTYLQSARPEERNAAFAYLEGLPVNDENRKAFVPRLEQMMGSEEFRGRALNALKTWGRKESAPAVRKWLQAANPNDTRADASQQQSTAIALLTSWSDDAAAEALAGYLKSDSHRGEASAALLTLGPVAEEPVLPLVEDGKAGVALEALKIVAQVGTEKSLLPIHRALYSPLDGVPDAANEALKQVATRNSLTAEKSMYVLLDRYTVVAPTGFKAEDPGVPNVRTWTRQASGRTVKSVFNIGVRVAPPNHTIDMTKTRLETGTLVFFQTAAEANNVQRATRFQALDGDYLLELTAIVDIYDSAAGTNLNIAAKKIQKN